jgi:hypothetical protein
MLAGCPYQRSHFGTFANTTYNLLESLLAFFDTLSMSVSVASARRLLGPNFVLFFGMPLLWLSLFPPF